MRPFRRPHLRMAASKLDDVRGEARSDQCRRGDEAPRKWSVLDRGGEPRCAKQDCRRQEHAPDHRAATATAAYLDDVCGGGGVAVSCRRSRRRQETYWKRAAAAEQPTKSAVSTGQSPGMSTSAATNPASAATTSATAARLPIGE